MSDLDGDSTMHSSPALSAADDDDEMFPDEAVPTTPHNAAAHTINAASELSPPNSQGPAILPRSNLNANGKRPLSQAQAPASASSGVHSDAKTGYVWSKPEDQPGYEWKTTRAREDEARALDSIIEQAHMIKTRYGDPLDASIPATQSS